MKQPRKGLYLGEHYFRNMFQRRAKELGLQPDIVDYLLQDFNGRDEVLNDVATNQEFANVIISVANRDNIAIIDTELSDLTDDFKADCCMSMAIRFSSLGIKPEETIFWFDAAWEFAKGRLQEQERVKNIIRRSLKKKQYN